MKVLCDFHHGGLYHAMQLLFEKRLGYEIYRPIGYEWLPWWRVSDLEPTQRAYLNPGGEHWLADDGYWRWVDHGAELEHKCLTFEQFCNEDVGLIVSTHPGHERTWCEMWRKHKPTAKLIRVAGNTGETINPAYTFNLLDSTSYFHGQAPNFQTFHQEFPLDAFTETAPPERLIMRQYLNFFKNHPMYEQHWQRYKPLLPEFEWRMHGHQGDHGFLHPLSRIAASMLDSTFVWHIKQEGYGHVLHNAFAAGRPVITHIADYRERTGGALLEDGVTCIDIGKGSVADNVAKIRHYAKRENLLPMCKAARERFGQVVDFDKEEQEIRAFMRGLV